MYLEASSFEDFVETGIETTRDRFEKITYAMDGHAIELKLVDVRTYGGQIRMYMDADGVPIDTGSTTVPMRIKRPFRLAPQSAYVLYFHIKLKNIPKSVIARIIPTKRASEIGILFTDIHTDGGELTVTVLPLRMVEVLEGFPLAWLVFIPKENRGTERSENNEDVVSTVRPTPRKSNAKNSRTRS